MKMLIESSLVETFFFLFVIKIKSFKREIFIEKCFFHKLEMIYVHAIYRARSLERIKS